MKIPRKLINVMKRFKYIVCDEEIRDFLVVVHQSSISPNEEVRIEDIMLYGFSHQKEFGHNNWIVHFKAVLRKSTILFPKRGRVFKFADYLENHLGVPRLVKRFEIFENENCV